MDDKEDEVAGHEGQLDASLQRDTLEASKHWAGKGISIARLERLVSDLQRRKMGRKMKRTARAMGGRAPCIIPLTAVAQAEISERSSDEIEFVQLTNRKFAEPGQPGSTNTEG